MWLSVAEWAFILCGALMVYTHIVYPALAVLVGGNKYSIEDFELPGITVLVPAYNEGQVIANKIDNFLTLDYPSEKIEMLIVDDGSSDNTRSIITEKLENNIRLLDRRPRSGKPTGLNRMVVESRHPLLLFCDANVMFSSDAPRRLAQHMLREDVGAVTGEVSLIGSNAEFESGESLYYKIERRIQEAESRIASVMGVDGGMYLLRKDLFQPLSPCTILDDFVISMRVIRRGYRIVYDRGIKATECGTPSSSQEYRRRVRMMSGVVQILRSGFVPKWNQPILWYQFFSHKILRWVTPFLLMVTLFCSLCIRELHLVYMVALVSQISIYTLFVLTCLSRRIRQMSLAAIIFYFFISQVAMVEGIIKGILNQQHVLWDKGQRANVSESASQENLA